MFLWLDVFSASTGWRFPHEGHTAMAKRGLSPPAEDFGHGGALWLGQHGQPGSHTETQLHRLGSACTAALRA